MAWRLLCVPAVLPLVLIAALPLAPTAAAAEPVMSVLPAAAGQSVTYRVTRTLQGAGGPDAVAQTYRVTRRGPATLEIERVDPHAVPTAAVLNVGANGTVALADPAIASAEPGLNDAVYAFDAAIVATREATGSPHDSWASYVPVSGANGAPTAGITFVPANVAGAEMDFYGTGQVAPGNPRAKPSATPSPEQRSRGGRGGFGGGGFGGRGGGGDRDERAGRGAEPAADAVATTLHVDGHFSAKRLTKLTITETRSVTVANMPFTNVSSWSLTVMK
jgi:hypothetical protein